jgi:putative transposase
MSKEEFMTILERQQASGLSISAFCENEIYPVSSFHYWKSKFGLTRTYNNSVLPGCSELFAPVNFAGSTGKALSSPASSSVSGGEIRVELPGGIQIIFRGSSETEIAVGFIHQIYSSHVLSK